MTEQHDALVRRCATCKYWQGDKEKASAMYKENPISMDFDRGWPEDADCGLSYKWAELSVEGDAVAWLYVPANFGCVHWCA